MTESQVVNGWIEKAAADAQLRTTRDLLLRVLHRRFPGAVPPEVVETIKSQGLVQNRPF